MVIYGSNIGSSFGAVSDKMTLQNRVLNCMKQENSTETNGFGGLNINPKLLEVIKKAGFETPTPIQREAMPLAIQGGDLVGLAQTGTGKTLAFAVPMLQRLASEGGQGLVLLPTRELALQVDEEYKKLAKQFGLRTAILIGGASINVQRQQLKRKPHVIIATPGRLIDVMERKWISLDNVRVLVLDEADRMLDMGFMPQIRKILQHIPESRQTMLFSATMPLEIERLSKKFMNSPKRIEVAKAGRASDLVQQSLYVVPKSDKIRLLKHIARQENGTILVFIRTKHAAKRIAQSLVQSGEKAAEIHSNLTLAQRRKALEGFKAGKHRILVATDIAARGIDVSGISLVINYDLPESAEDYVHRVGRTGRAETSGRAISFAEPDQGKLVTQIEEKTQVHLKPLKLPIKTDAKTEGLDNPIRRRSSKRKQGSSGRKTNRGRSGRSSKKRKG